MGPAAEVIRFALRECPQAAAGWGTWVALCRPGQLVLLVWSCPEVGLV